MGTSHESNMPVQLNPTGKMRSRLDHTGLQTAVMDLLGIDWQSRNIKRVEFDMQWDQPTKVVITETVFSPEGGIPEDFRVEYEVTLRKRNAAEIKKFKQKVKKKRPNKLEG